MRLVEKEDEFGFDGVTDFRKLFKQLAHKPEQEGGIEPGAGHQLVGGQDVDVSQARPIGAHQVIERESWFAKHLRATLILQDQELALDGGNGGRRDVAVLGSQV